MGFIDHWKRKQQEKRNKQNWRESIRDRKCDWCWLHAVDNSECENFSVTYKETAADGAEGRWLDLESRKVQAKLKTLQFLQNKSLPRYEGS